MQTEYNKIALQQPRRWNLTGYECYKIKGECEICPLYNRLESIDKICYMKVYVVEMLRLFGKPTKEIKKAIFAKKRYFPDYDFKYVQ